MFAPAIVQFRQFGEQREHVFPVKPNPPRHSIQVSNHVQRSQSPGQAAHIGDGPPLVEFMSPNVAMHLSHVPVVLQLKATQLSAHVCADVVCINRAEMDTTTKRHIFMLLDEATECFIIRFIFISVSLT